MYFELEPGMHVGMHRDSSEELLLILEGEGEATVGDETAVAQAGAMLTVPAMEPHDIRNVGDGSSVSSASSPRRLSSRPSTSRSRQAARRCS